MSQPRDDARDVPDPGWPDPVVARPPGGSVGDQVARIDADPEFHALVRSRGRLGLLVVCVMMAVYFGYILALAFAPALMQRHVSTHITIGFPLGLAVLVVTFLLVLLQVGRSAAVLEPMTRRVLDRSRR